MTPESQYLRNLAEKIVETYGAMVAPHADLLTGSLALGESDRYSDLDLIFYHNSMASEALFSPARERLGAERYSALSPWSEKEFAEDCYLSGVECQLAHITVVAWEGQLAEVVVKFARMEPSPAPRLVMDHLLLLRSAGLSAAGRGRTVRCMPRETLLHR